MSSKIKKYFILFLVAIVVVIWYVVFYFEQHQNLLVTFFDVGQGDAALIEIPGGNQVLIDGGPDKKILSKLGRALPFWDREIDLLILTHPHADHLDGLLEVLKKYDVGMVIESGVNHSVPEYQEWPEILKEKKIKIVTASAGQKLLLGKNVKMDILSPFKNFSGQTVKNVHEATVASRLSYGKNSILFMGDAEKSLEYQMIFQGEKLDSDILKAGHHGSKTSSSEEFLKAVSPQAAIISAGRKNRYGHPHQEVLERLEKFGIKIFRTDLDGDIYLKSDGDMYSFSQ